MNSTNIRPLIGLLGVLVAALSADLNEFVSGAALIDYRGALGISADPGRWIEPLRNGDCAGYGVRTLECGDLHTKTLHPLRYWLGMRGHHSSGGRAESSGNPCPPADSGT